MNGKAKMDVRYSVFMRFQLIMTEDNPIAMRSAFLSNRLQPELQYFGSFFGGNPDAVVFLIGERERGKIYLAASVEGSRKSLSRDCYSMQGILVELLKDCWQVVRLTE